MYSSVNKEQINWVTYVLSNLGQVKYNIKIRVSITYNKDIYSLES